MRFTSLSNKSGMKKNILQFQLNSCPHFSRGGESSNDRRLGEEGRGDLTPPPLFASIHLLRESSNRKSKLCKASCLIREKPEGYDYEHTSFLFAKSGSWCIHGDFA